MLSYRLQLLLIILITGHLFNDSVYGQLQLKYSEQINLISHYGSNNQYNFTSKDVTEIQKKGINGFIFDLELSADSNAINIITRNNTNTNLSLICDSLYSFCKRDTSNILTLFFDYDFDSSILQDSLKRHPIYNYIYQGDFNLEWPTLGKLVSNNNQIICFAYTPQSSSNPLIKYIWKYAAKPCTTKDIEPKLNGEFCEGSIKKKLLYLTSYQTPTANGKNVIHGKKLDTNLDPFFISHALNMWKNTGKRINFLIYDVYDKNYTSLKNHLNTQNNISGTISYNRKPLQRVFWEGDFNAVTHGEYSFPVTLNDDIKLRPQSPGFRFVPEEINLSDITKPITQNFIAIPLELNNNMSIYLPFIDATNDDGPRKFKTENHGCQLVIDGNRNEVAEFDGKSYIILPEANTLGMSNSDFTVSAWIKLARDNTRRKRDFSILGTKENYYRGGLHLQTRDNKPYFGFFSNDLWGNTELASNRWYHVVWRYSKYNQEQAIFVNGKEDASSLNHPAFVSNSNIYIGRSINQNNLFEGRIDNLIIWDRALGEEEIWNLYQDVSYIENSTVLNFIKRNKFWLGAMLFLITILALFFKKKNTKQNSSGEPKNINNIQITDHTPNTNTIKLFGNFQVLDKTGENITNKFTPRLKQIFIYLIIKSKDSSNGVSSEQFINDIWPSFDRKKAINNRGVSISKLRSVLELMDEITIFNHQERWKIEFSSNIYCDYYDSISKLNLNLFSNRDDLNSFLCTVQRGAFLHDCNDSSFDDIKGKFSNKIIDILTRLLSDFDISQNPEVVITIADRILAADDVNEDALKYKIKALLVLRQTNQAKFLFKSFKEKHEEIYNEKFPITFEELIH